MLKRMRFIPSRVKLAEGAEGVAPAPAKTVQVMRTGSFKHPEYGNFSITKEHLDSFVKNFNERVRGIDIATDYKHDSEAEAAGWFERVFVEPDSERAGEFVLMADMDWTKPASEKLLNKEFRYLSADFTLNYVDPETSKKFGPVLLGAGLTNRPFIKGMDPVVTLSEQKEGANAMTLEQAMAKIAELEAKLAAMGGTPEQFSQMRQQFAEAQKTIDAYKAKEAEQEKATKLSEKKSKFDKMLSEKKVVEAQREAFMGDDFAKFAELAMPAPKEEKKATGSEGGGTNTEGDASDKILALAETLVKEKKASSLDKAVSMVLADPEHKALREEHEKQFN